MSHALLSVAAAENVMQMELPDVVGPFPTTGYLANDVLLAPAAAGVIPDADIEPLPDAPAVLAGHYLYDFYYRIWVVPETMDAQNPVIGQPIPFSIWNAYPQPTSNVLEDIQALGGEGLEFDFDVGTIWKAIEYKAVSITITPSAPIDIAATFEFHFTDGVGLFYFNANIADFVQMVPDPPVVETWGWLTDVIPARNGKEQRIALRDTPRRGIQYSFLLENETERRRQYNRWFKSLAGRIVLPYYQYATSLTQQSAPGTSKLFFDPAKTDVRDAEFVLVYHDQTQSGYLIKLDTVVADGATTDSPLTFTADTDMIVAPAFTSRLSDRTGLTMLHVTGNITVQAQALDSRLSFKRPGSTAVIQTYDGIPVLHLRPIAAGETPEIFEANYEVVDGETGVTEIFSSWEHPAVGGSRKWTIRRRQNPAEMDWWRDFLDTVVGQREPFLMATWFADLALAEDPPAGSPQLIVNAPDYASLYFPFETYKRIQLETEAGLVWRRVVAATDNEDGTTTLDLDTPLGLTLEEVTISKISFLNLTRLASDTVTLTHDRIRSQIDLATRTVDV